MASGNEELIDSYISRQGFKDDTEFAKGKLNELFVAFKRLEGVKISLPKVDGLGGLTTAVNEANAAAREYEKTNAALAKTSKEAAQIALLEAKATKELAAAKAIEEKSRLNNEAAARKESVAVKKTESGKLKDRPISDIPFEIKTGGEDDIENLKKTGVAVSELDLQLAEAENSATALGKAQHQLSNETDISSNAFKVQLTALERNIEERRNLETSISSLKKEQKEDTAALKSGEITRAEYNRRMNESGIVIAQQKAKLSDLNKEIKAQTISTKEAANLYAQLSKNYNEVALQAKNYNLQLGENHPLTLQTTARAKQLGDQLKTLDAQVGQNQRKVGDYTGGITSAFGKMFGYLRTAANIIPGLGIGGLIGGLAVGFASFFKTLFIGKNSFDAVKASAKAYGDVLKDIADNGIKGSAGEISKLEVLRTIITDVTKTQKERNDALNTYNGIADEANKIDIKQIDNITLVNDKINTQITLIEKRALARAAESILADKAEKLLLEKEEARRKAQADELIDIKEGRIVFDQRFDKESEFIKLERNRAIEGRINSSEKVKQAQIEFDAAKKGLYGLIDVQGYVGEKTKEIKGKTAKDTAEAERKAALELFKFNIGLLIEIEKNKVAISKGSFRDTARIRQADLEKELIKGVAEFEAKEKGIAVSKVILIERKKNEELKVVDRERLLDIMQFAIDERAEIIKSAQETGDLLAKEEAETQKKIQEEKARAKQFQINNLTSDFERQQRNIAENASLELKAESDRFTKGLVKKDEYEKNKLIIENKARRDSLEAEIKYYEALILISDLSTEDQKKAIQALHDLRIKLRALDVSDADKKKEKEKKDLEDIKKALGDLGRELTGLTLDVFTNAIDRQKNAIQDTIDLLDKQKAKDIEVANQTIANAAQRADAIAVIEARAAAQKQQLELRQRQLDQQKARFEKARSVAEIIANTAVAVAKALPNFILAAIVGAIGAAQLVRVLATPIPRYKHGKNIHDTYEGPAIVDDGGRPEAIIRETGDVEIGTSKPRVTWVGSKDIILPNTNLLLNHLHTRQTRNLSDNVYNVTNTVDLEPVTNVLGKKIDRLNTTIKNKTENHFLIEGQLKSYIKKHGDSWTHYLNRNL